MSSSPASTFSTPITNAQSMDINIPAPNEAPIIEDISSHAPLASNTPSQHSWAQASAAVMAPPLPPLGGAPMAAIPEDMEAPPLPQLSAAASSPFQPDDMMPPALPQLQATPSAMARAFSDSDNSAATPMVIGATPLAAQYSEDYMALHPTSTQEEAQTQGFAQALRLSPAEAEELLWEAVRLNLADEEVGNVVGGAEHQYKWTTIQARCISFCDGTYCDTIGVAETEPVAAEAAAVQGKQYVSVTYGHLSRNNRKMSHSGDKIKHRQLVLADGRRINARELSHTMSFTNEFTTGFVANAAWKTSDRAIPLTRLGDACLPELPLILEIRGTYPDADGNVVRARHIIPVCFRNDGCTAANCADDTHDLCQASKNHTAIANVKVTRDPVTGRFRAVIIREFLQGFADGTTALEQSIRDKGL
jgi:hypothetical protein